MDKIGDPYLQLGRVLLFLITFCVALQFTFVTRLTGQQETAPKIGG